VVVGDSSTVFEEGHIKTNGTKENISKYLAIIAHP
jgi:hypothetical protein